MTNSQLNTLFEEAKYEELIAEIEQAAELSSEFKEKLALSYYHTENYGKSTPLFSQLSEGSQDSIKWFNLCTSAIRNNEERIGLDALHKAIRFNRETKTDGEGMPTPFMQLYAAQALIHAEKYNLAFNQLNELAEVYGSLSKTESKFLYDNGVPAFDEFLKLGKAILAKQTVTDASDWIAYTSTRLDDEGKAKLLNI